MHGVIANLLNTRNDVCYIVSGDRADTDKVERPDGADRIEPVLLERVVSMHDVFCRAGIASKTDLKVAKLRRREAATTSVVAVNMALLGVLAMRIWWT